MLSMKSEVTHAHSWQFDALGTSWELASAQSISPSLKKVISKQLSLFEHTYSRFMQNSLVSAIARKPGTYTFPESATEIFSFYEQLFFLTSGKMTPLVGDALSSAGYDERYSLKPRATIRKVDSYTETVTRSGHVITMTRPCMLDIGAVGKGYAVDMIVKLLKTEGHKSFVVDASGDMRVVGYGERIGLENPFNFQEVIGTVELQDKALCASANNRRAWGDWHHILDPHLREPTREIVATWVVADSAMIADGLATALFFVAPETLSSKYNYEYMRIHANGSIEYSDYFAGGIFI